MAHFELSPDIGETMVYSLEFIYYGETAIFNEEGNYKNYRKMLSHYCIEMRKTSPEMLSEPGIHVKSVTHL